MGLKVCADVVCRCIRVYLRPHKQFSLAFYVQMINGNKLSKLLLAIAYLVKKNYLNGKIIYLQSFFLFGFIFVPLVLV